MEVDPIINEISSDPITKAETTSTLRKIKTGNQRGRTNLHNNIKITHDSNREMASKLIQNFLDAKVSQQLGDGDDIVNLGSKARVFFMKLTQIWS